MKINSVEIENFLSIEKAVIDFEDYEGVVRVEGRNLDTNPTSSNGAGKSSIIEAIVYALFGKTIRKTSEKSLINSFTKGKCQVTLRVNDNVVIKRVKRPPSLIVEVDGKGITKEGILQTQEYLEEVLNTNYNVFLASIVFGQQNKMNFLSCTPEEKRSIMQSFLNVTDLFKNRSKIRSLKSAYNSDKRVAATLQTESLQKANTIKKRIAKIKNDLTQATALFSKPQAEFISKYSLSDIKNMEEERESRETDLAELQNNLHTATKDADRCKEGILHFTNNSVCEHCGEQPEVIIFKIRDLSSCLSDSYVATSNLRKEIQRKSKEVDSLSIPINSVDFELMESIKSLEAENSFISKPLRQQQRLSRKYSKQMEEAQKKYDMLKFWETAFSEQGLVKYIIVQILDFFNERCNYYLSILSNNSFVIEFDELLNEEIKSSSHTIHFESLSGGEKKKFSLSVMLALNDLLVLSGKDRSDLIFFDEVADSLDKEGIKGLYDLIQEISVSKKLFLITHNQYLVSLIEDDVEELLVTKKNNITVFK